MATRLYFSSTTLPGVSPTTISAEWEHSSGAYTPPIRQMGVTPTLSAMTNFSATYDAVDHTLVNADALIARYVSPALFAQSIPSQTVKLQIRCSEQRATNNLFLAWKVYLITSTGAVRAGGTLITARRDTLEVVATTLTNRSDSATSGGPSINALLNDRICLEIGLGGTPQAGPSIDGHNGALRFGDTGELDLPENDTAVTDERPWIEFTSSTAISFVPVTTPTTRVTQDSLELLYDESVASTPETRITQDSLEVLESGVSETRLTQDSFECLYDESISAVPETRVTQDSLEVLQSGTRETRVTQDSLEALYDEIVLAIPKTFVTQDSIEVLWEEPPPPEEEPPDVGCPLGQISRVHGEQGQITHVQATFGQVSRVHAEDGQINCD